MRKNYLATGLVALFVATGTVAAASWFPLPSLPSRAQAQTGADADRLIEQGLEQQQAGEINAAIASFQRARDLFQALGERQNAAIAMTNLGSAYQDRGDYQRARALHAQALTLAQQVGDRETAALNRSFLGAVYNALGEYQQSLAYHEAALAFYRQQGDRLRESAALTELGGVYLHLGQFRRARDLQEQALAQAEAADAPLMKLIALNNLGLAHYQLGDPEQAIALHEQQLTLARDLANEPGEVLALGNLGLAYSDLGDDEQAIALHEAALASQEARGDRPGAVNSLGNLGLAYRNLGDLARAREFLERALALAEEISDRRKAGLARNFLGLLDLEQGQFEAAEGQLRAAADLWEAIRADLGDDNDAGQVSLLDAQADTYRWLQAALVAQNQPLAALEAAERGRARAFVELYAERLGNTAIEPPTVAELRQLARDQNATLVEYSVVEDRIYIWVIDPSGEIDFRQSSFEAVEIDSFARFATRTNLLASRSAPRRPTTPLDELAQGLRSAARSSGGGGRRANVRLRRSYDLLIEPIADLLPDDPAARVAIVPHDQLFVLPFAAFQDAEGTYLIEKHTLVAAPALQVFALAQQHRANLARNPSDAVLVVGNPTMPTLGGQPLTPLPGAEAEARSVAQLLATSPLLGDRASESAIAERLPTARVIHFATHGLLGNFSPWGAPGALALAPTADTDGLLVANELLGLQLNADLVALSACDTGRGRITGDGVYGLSRAFLTAGAASLVATLWKIPDEPSAYLMQAFYENWVAGSDKATALRQAMLATKAVDPDPSDWAAFVLFGAAE